MQLEVNEMYEDSFLFWKHKQHRATFPNLTGLTCYFFAILCSSATTEWQFCTAGQIAMQRRSNLDQSTMNGILFLRSIEKNKSMILSFITAGLHLLLNLSMYIFIYLFMHMNELFFY